MQRHCNQAEFIFPRDGVMLTWAAGEKVGEALKIRVLFSAQDGKELSLNGTPMTRVNFCEYSAEILLSDFKNTLEVRDLQTGETWAIDVYFLKNGYKKYRISLDDNIWFLQNLTENKDTYTSLFDDPYLKMLKYIHDRYGSKFHVNIYYETPRHGGFNLSQMTDKYKPEWKANSHWLRLSFHANADKPDKPYRFATYEQAYFEMERVHQQILRFAGPEAFSQTATSVHWGDCSYEAARAFRDLGVKEYVSSFKWDTDSNADIRMYFDAEQCAIMQKYGFYYDKDTDMYFHRYQGGIQHAQLETFYDRFDRLLEEHPLYQFMEFCLHEQYFYPEYFAYQPNYYEKLETTAQWCRDRGFEPVFADEMFGFHSHSSH